MDSGIDTDNSLLAHAIKGGTSVVDWSNNYEDYTGHGTKVAGTIITKHKNKIYGIAPDVELYAVKITLSKSDGRTILSNIIKGIEWSIENEMDIINISYDARAVSKEFKRVAKRAKDNNILIVNSTGNSNQNVDNEITRCQYEGVVCVSTLNKFDKLGYISAYGKQYVHFGVAGINIVSAEINSNNPITVSGASYSAPVFVGLYALHKSEYPDATVDEIMTHMQKTVIKINIDKPIGKYGKAYYIPMEL